MKVTSIEIHPDGSSAFCNLSFRDPKRNNPFHIKGVFGLDADVIVPRYYAVSGGGGHFRDRVSGEYYNLVMESRDVTLRIELNPDFSVNESYSDLRDTLAKMIASSRTGAVTLQFKNGTTVVAILKGFIKRFEAPASTKTPEVQLTIECIDPMLKAPNPTDVDLTGFDPGYTILVDDESTAPHGFNFIMNITGAPDKIIIEDPTDSSWTFEIDPFASFVPGDTLFFSSEPKNKYLYVDRGGEIIHLVDALTSASVWPIMFPGDNAFSFSSSLMMNWESISFTPTYWGI